VRVADISWEFHGLLGASFSRGERDYRPSLSQAGTLLARLAAHSITSSASAKSLSGTVRPSALAVFKLMTRSNLVGCSTARSAGFAPRRILST
jgi:hypothetical protein